MRKLAVATLLVAMVVLGASASAGERAPIGLRYDWEGMQGVLTMANAEGMPFAVWNPYGLMLLSGVAHAPHAEYPVPNSGVSVNGVVLYIRVGTSMHTVTSKDWIWE